MVSIFQSTEFGLGLGLLFTNQIKYEVNNTRRWKFYKSKDNTKLGKQSTFF